MNRFYISMAHELEGVIYESSLRIKTSPQGGAILAFTAFDLAQNYLTTKNLAEKCKITEILPTADSEERDQKSRTFLIFEDCRTYNDFMEDPRTFDYTRCLKEETI